MLEGAKHRVSIYYQGYDVITAKYVEHFKALVGVIETYGGTYGNEPRLITAQLIKQGQPGSIDSDKIKKAEAMCCEQYLLCMILQGLDSTRYYQLKTDLTNNMAKGRNDFPKTIVEVVQLLNNYKVPTRTPAQPRAQWQQRCFCSEQ
jgi:hypothetical protein